MMNERDINNQYDSWLSLIARNVISRSSGLLSAETQKDGRMLLLLSAFSSLLFIGIVKVKEVHLFDAKLDVPEGFALIAVELVCLYFAVTFSIDAYSDLRIWHFKGLIKESDHAIPIEDLTRESEALSTEGNAILDKYEASLKAATKALGLDTAPEAMPDTNDDDKRREYITKMEYRMEQQKKLLIVQDILLAAQEVELNELKMQREILNSKVKSLRKALRPMKRLYNMKLYVTISLPLLAFVISLAAYVFYLLKQGWGM